MRPRLPWGKHQSGNYSHFLNTKFEPDDDGAIQAILNGRKTTEFDLDKIIPEAAIKPHVAKGEGHAQSEVLEMLKRPLLIGERRPTLVKLAGYLRFRGIPEEVAVALLLPWAKRAFNDPLPADEVERHVRGIYHRYGVAAPRHSRKPTRPFRLEVPL